MRSGCNLARGFDEGQPAAAHCWRRKAARGRAVVLRAVLCAIAALSAFLACAKRPTMPTTPTATAIEEAAARAYRSLVATLGVDASPVREQTIVLDPGHGGGYRGAVGPRGTAEADVNLAVALFLWGLLDDAGADVHLTRSADRDFVGGALRPPAIVPLAAEGATRSAGAPPPIGHPDSLPADLAARVARANALGADLFLSIHHNADASGDTTRNQTQTFYRLGDPGPSLDAAQAIHRHLVRNLTPASAQVLPGNYHVLRNSNATAAVLGEASFLTNPALEEKLLRIDRVELEATAYFLGIVDYFARGVAAARVVAPRDTVLDRETVDLRARFTGDPIDPATVEIALDGTPLPVRAVAGADYVAAAPALLANGRHEVRASGRTLGGNAAAPARARFEIRRPPAEIRAEAWPPWNGTDAPDRRGLAVMVRDRRGLPVADSTAVTLTSPVAASARTRAGAAWFRPVTPPSPGAAWTVAAGPVTTSVPAVSPGAPPAWTGTIIDALTNEGVPGATISGPGGDRLGHANPAGEFALAAPAGTVHIAARGYVPRVIAERSALIALAPVLGGVLAGVTVAIDAAGGGADPLFVSPTGVRAADTALDVARRLAGDLDRAGAETALARRADLTIPDLARVEVAELARADRYIRVSAGPEPRVRHYPGSARGERLARRIATAMEQELGLLLPVRAEVTPVLLATSMPAVEIVLPAPADPAREDEHLSPAFRRQTARALLLALAAEAGLDLDRQLLVRVESSALQVLIDGAIVAETRHGPALVRGLEPDPAVHWAAPLAAGLAGPGITFAGGQPAPRPDTLRIVVPAASPAPADRPSP